VVETSWTAECSITACSMALSVSRDARGSASLVSAPQRTASSAVLLGAHVAHLHRPNTAVGVVVLADGMIGGTIPPSVLPERQAALRSAPHVSCATMPSAFSPRSAWKVRTAVSVSGPNSPSTPVLPTLYPRLVSMH